MLPQRCKGFVNLLKQHLGDRAAVAERLASDQVVRLDRRRAFVDRQNARVAVVLRGASLFDETHPAMHLYTQARDVDRQLRTPTLYDWHQILVDRLMVGSHGLVGVTMGDVAVGSRHVGERTGAFSQRAHRREHAAHVRMLNDRHGLFSRTVDRPALHAVLRIGNGFLISAIGDSNALHADTKARCVHHDEHVLEAAVGLADQVTDCAAVIAKLQHRGGARLDAQLVFDRHAMHVVARAKRAVVVDHELRHDEERDAPHAFRRVRQAREHKVHDVLRHIVLAPGDEDLRAENAVRAVALGFGACAHEREIGTGLRFREIHRTGPLARDQLRHVALLLLLAARGQQRLDRAVGQQRTQRERQVRGIQHFDARRGKQLRQALAAIFGGVNDTLPAALGELLKCFLETRRGGDHAVLPAARVPVAFKIQWRQHILVKAGGFFEHGLRSFNRRVLEAGQRRYLIETCKFINGEQHVLDGRGIAHPGSSQWWNLKGCHDTGTPGPARQRLMGIVAANRANPADQTGPSIDKVGQGIRATRPTRLGAPPSGRGRATTPGLSRRPGIGDGIRCRGGRRRVCCPSSAERHDGRRSDHRSRCRRQSPRSRLRFR